MKCLTPRLRDKLVACAVSALLLLAGGCSSPSHLPAYRGAEIGVRSAKQKRLQELAVAFPSARYTAELQKSVISNDELLQLLEVYSSVELRQRQIWADAEKKFRELEASGNKYAKQRGVLTLTGVGIAIASVALVAANPAANAVWISGLGAAGGGLVTYQSVRAEDGYTPAYARQRMQAVRSAFQAAVAAYNSAAGAFQQASGASDIAKMRTAITQLTVAQGEESLALLADFGIKPDAADVTAIKNVMLEITNQAQLAGKAAEKAAVARELANVTKVVAAQQALVDEAQKAVDTAQSELDNAADDAAKAIAKPKLDQAIAALGAAKKALEPTQKQEEAVRAIHDYLNPPAPTP